VKEGSINQVRGDQVRGDEVVIARILKARGIKGEVAASIETDFPERFAALDRVTVAKPDGSRTLLRMEDHWFHKGRVILKFEGYDSMTAAKELAGSLLVVPESEREALPEDRFYEYNIVGAEAITAGGQRLGPVTRLMHTGGTDLLVVEGESGREYLIPFADDICTEIDVDAKRIVVNPPEGLLDL
jgi:16S rRNA processing protein RimM